MMNLIAHVQTFLKKENLENKKLLLGVSGGVDSMVMLDVVAKVVPTELVAVVHIDHGARKESQEEQNVVQEICSKNNIQFYSERLDLVPEKDRENFWRQERQRIFDIFKKKWGADRVLTAHHATDLVETMIFRLTKGVGVSGLSPFDITTKPLWDIPKSDLYTYAKEHTIEYFEDESNTDISYHRNLIRQNVIPELRKITPNLEKVFVQEAQVFGEVGDFVQKSVGWILPSFSKGRAGDGFDFNKNPSLTLPLKKGENQKGRALDLQEFLQIHPARQREFLRSVAVKTPSFSDVEDCLRWLRGNPQGGSAKEIGGRMIILQGGFIRIMNDEF